MLDHISLGVTDLGRSRAFYDKALAPLGYGLQHEIEGGFGYGPSREQATFWLSLPFEPGARARACPGTHVAFLAADRATVDAFYAAALTAGGRDNGKPGLRPEYHATYYAAFVLDPDGHNVEAVCHKPGSFENQFNPQ